LLWLEGGEEEDVRARYKNVRSRYIIGFDLNLRGREDGVDEKGE
jgi:hypothetical protein